MDVKKILTLDLSTACTGWAIFDAETKKLLDYGKIKSTAKGKSKMCKVEKTLTNMMEMAAQIEALVRWVEPIKIVIEEITGSKNYLGQKTLDGFHWIVVYVLRYDVEKIIYYPVSGLGSWRKDLRFLLSDADKAANKEARKLNKKIQKSQQLPVIGPKHLACRYVLTKFGIDLDPYKENDMADAIAMGDAFLTFRFTEL